ncbi:MAG: formylglycine-generating enzyme family protein [Cyanobacteria bacterium P01_E01_bin.6]
MSAPPSSDVKPQVKIAKQTLEVPFFRERLSDTVAIEMMQVKSGEFLMGSPEKERDRSNSEGPQHLVQVPGFWMGKYPVTQSQWRIVAGLPQEDHLLDETPSSFKGDDCPVERVSWDDAVEFCKRLSTYTKRPYRLPSEAEWEYACRAGTTTPFHFGETITTDLANYDGTDDPDGKWSGSYGDGPKGEYRQETTPVGQFGVANTFGLCDMHGNVLEWCQDPWHDNYEAEPPTDGSAWIEGGNDRLRVFRGGSWYDNPRYCRSAYRLNTSRVNRYINFGFRVVCAVQ